MSALVVSISSIKQAQIEKKILCIAVFSSFNNSKEYHQLDHIDWIHFIHEKSPQNVKSYKKNFKKTLKVKNIQEKNVKSPIFFYISLIKCVMRVLIRRIYIKLKCLEYIYKAEREARIGVLNWYLKTDDGKKRACHNGKLANLHITFRQSHWCKEKHQLSFLKLLSHLWHLSTLFREFLLKVYFPSLSRFCRF